MNQLKDKADYNVVIERIVTIDASEDKFIPKIEIDWQEYFSGMIGVSSSVDGTIEEVILHFNQLTGSIWKISLHETQRHKCLDENTFEVRIKVYMNYELERLILSYGESITVLEPLYFQGKKKSISKRDLISIDYRKCFLFSIFKGKCIDSFIILQDSTTF